MQGIPEQVARWATGDPEATAVTCGSRSWTYQQLSAAVDRACTLLAESGAAPDDVVAVIAARGLALVAAWIAVLNHQAVLLPIDPRALSARRDGMLSLAGAMVVLVDSDAADLPANRRVAQLDIEEPRSSPSAQFIPGSGAGGGYVCFTSGSTGTPKAILGRHDSLTHFLGWQRRTLDVGPGDRVAQLASVEFDPSLREIFLPLTSGGVLCFPPPETLAAGEVLGWLASNRVTIAHAVPTVARAWLRSTPDQVRLPNLRTTLFGGEPLTDTLVDQWRQQLNYDEPWASRWNDDTGNLETAWTTNPDTPTDGQPPVTPLVLGRPGRSAPAPAGLGPSTPTGPSPPTGSLPSHLAGPSPPWSVAPTASRPVEAQIVDRLTRHQDLWDQAPTIYALRSAGTYQGPPTMIIDLTSDRVTFG